MVGKFGEAFTLAIWWSRRKLPNLIPPILNSMALASWLHNYKYRVHQVLLLSWWNLCFSDQAP